MDLFSLTGKVAAITGTTRGIGKAAALALAEHGADIALLQRNEDCAEVKELIEAMGRKCRIFACDMSNMKQVKEIIPKIINQFGDLDILVNSAGIQRRSSAEFFSEKDWDDVIEINLKSVWILSQSAGSYMVKKKKGKIINLASLLSFQGGLNVPAYAAAKGGVAQLTKSLANEWAKYHVNVNAIVPGYVATDMNRDLMNDEERNKQILDRIPAQRWGRPEDFKGSVVYLASDASNYVHGHLLVVDGGWMGR